MPYVLSDEQIEIVVKTMRLALATMRDKDEDWTDDWRDANEVVNAIESGP